MSLKTALNLVDNISCSST